MYWHNNGPVPTTYPGPTGLSVPRCRCSRPSHYPLATLARPRAVGETRPRRANCPRSRTGPRFWKLERQYDARAPSSRFLQARRDWLYEAKRASHLRISAVASCSSVSKSRSLAMSAAIPQSSSSRAASYSSWYCGIGPMMRSSNQAGRASTGWPRTVG